MGGMTQIEQAMSDLRSAVRQELIDELKAWWAKDGHEYETPGDAIEDALITLEQV